MMETKTQVVEIFHLLFLFHFEKKTERNLYALKGGCNLRFFFKSIRYSEDIDFDIQSIAKDTLTRKVDKILNSPALLLNLRSKGIEILQTSKPKQTDTTQRWKILLKKEGLSFEIPTKIEFSRRSMVQTSIFEPIDNALIRQYALYPILSNHYPLQEAFNQKVDALINRTETQARDIFDLKLLFDQGATSKKIPSKSNWVETINIAIDRILSIDFNAFKSQVVAYLMDEYQSYYDSQTVWNEIQNEVIHKLKESLNDFN